MFDGTGLVTFYNVDAVHSFAFNDVTSPLTDFDPQVDMRTDISRLKLMAPGAWRTRTQRGTMSIHCEGSLFADDSASYVTSRKAMVLALFGDPDAVVVNDYMGELHFTPAGESEVWVAKYCAIEAFQAPVQALYPAQTNYLVTFRNFDPYFVGATSGDKYLWS